MTDRPPGNAPHHQRRVFSRPPVDGTDEENRRVG